MDRIEVCGWAPEAAAFEARPSNGRRSTGGRAARPSLAALAQETAGLDRLEETARRQLAFNLQVWGKPGVVVIRCCETFISMYLVDARSNRY